MKAEFIPKDFVSVKVKDRFGRLTVLQTGRLSNRSFALCQCDCGSEPKLVRLDALMSGRTTSCKCFWREQNFKHGLSKHPLFRRHGLMISRCTDPADPAYHNYGGRGIKICQRWLDVKNFINDLEPLFTPGLELDRVDNNGDYEPSNCHFVTRAENTDNRRTGTRLTFGGKTQSLLKWAKELGINYKTLYTRLFQDGWSIERALTTPTFNVNDRMLKARNIRWGKNS